MSYLNSNARKTKGYPLSECLKHLSYFKKKQKKNVQMGQGIDMKIHLRNILQDLKSQVTAFKPAMRHVFRLTEIGQYN